MARWRLLETPGAVDPHTVVLRETDSVSGFADKVAVRRASFLASGSAKLVQAWKRVDLTIRRSGFGETWASGTSFSPLCRS